MSQTWPSQRDYIEALQDPASAFADVTLRNAVVEGDVFGLPRPRSGRMASVYKVFDGDKIWALRCFNFQSDARAERYRAISDFLVRHPNRYTVGFDYRDDGIALATGSFPVVKMEWVEGELLHSYLYARRHEPAALLRLADAWVTMARSLHALGLAHGDLQHGNVLVTPAGDVKLIDYDGMFVPAFARLRSLENGHPNYQHPCRLPRDFGPQLDNFSAWVVYISIVALARDASLWERLPVGDDRLAFGHDDYERPSQSAAFAALHFAADPDVRNMTRFFDSMLSQEPQKLPSLEGISLTPFSGQRLPRGTYVEPYRAEKTGAPIPGPLPPQRRRNLLLIGGGGGIAMLAGYVFQQFGFSVLEEVAILTLGTALAALVTFASRSPRPPP